MAPMEFTPRHAQPFTLEQAMMLEIDVLVAEIRRLENSIAHLLATQEELAAYLADTAEDADGEIAQAKEENDGVIASQRERIALIKVALINKLGEGGAKHYGLDNPSSPPEARGSPRAAGPAAAAMDATPATGQTESGPAVPAQHSTTSSDGGEGLHL